VRRFPRPRLTFANVVACLALFIALGGTGYAAFKLPRHSVGNPQLKRNAVTSSKVKKGGIGLSDIKASAKSKLSGLTDVVMRKGPETSVSSGNFSKAEAQCEPGEQATGGGVYNESSVFFLKITSSYPLPNPGTPPATGDGIPATGWRVWVANNAPAPDTQSFQAYVLCAS
jgi:hypothetical protein